MTRSLRPFLLPSTAFAALLSAPTAWSQGTPKPLLDGATTSVGYGANDVVTGDLNGDGHLDLVSANPAGDSISVRFGTGHGRFLGGAEYAMEAGPRDVVLGDLNGDGHLDVVTANHLANSITVRLGDGAGGFGAMSTTATGNEPS